MTTNPFMYRNYKCKVGFPVDGLESTFHVTDGQKEIHIYVILPIHLPPIPFKICALFFVNDWIIIIQHLNMCCFYLLKGITAVLR